VSLPLAGPEEVEVLLTRMRAGDREAAAAFVMSYGDRVRRRIRASLTPGMRRIFDSSEVLSSVARRLDSMVLQKKLEAITAGQLWSLVLTISDNAMVDRARVMRRLKRIEGEDSEVAQRLLSRLREAERRKKEGSILELDRILRMIESPEDRELLRLWLLDQPHAVIGEQLGISTEAARKRWQMLRERLKERLESIEAP
jgi:DNA-directed RNA polymerase specialized sigma24 family protein